jgi:DNA-binding LytR/AlgR family response regulator
MSKDFSALRILVVEDDPTYIHLLELLLQELGVKHIYKCMSYEAGWAAFQEQEPDICILDIMLSGSEHDGIHLASRIYQACASVPILFLTSFYQEEFYLRARDVQPSLFMSKDLSKLKLMQALDIACFHLSKTELSNNPSPAVEQQPVKQPAIYLKDQHNFFFRVGDVFHAFNIKEISYFFADNKMTYARIGKRNYPTSVQLKVLEDELHPIYLRCHKKYLVNTQKIESLLIREDKIKIGEELLPLGYHYRKSFLDALNVLK